MAVDGRDLRRPPRGAVDHSAVDRTGRVAQGQPVQLGPPGRAARPEGVVAADEIGRPCLLRSAQPDGEVQPGLYVKGVRGIASGLIAVILLAARMPHVLGWFELAASTIPIGDAIIVLRSNGPKATAYGVHGATAVVLLATAALLFT